MSLCVGLFGTCGGSTWRDPFKKKYDEMGIEYFDPQVDDWKEELAEIEATHLATDDVVLFPVLRETYGIGSLTEIAFAILQTIRLESSRDVVVLIESELDEKLADVASIKESLKARNLVRAHILEGKYSNVYLVDTLEQMLEVSLVLHEIARKRESIEGYNPHRKVEAS